jgi:hypothetical protein
MFIKTLNGMKKKNKPQNNTKCTPKKYIFLLKMYHHNVLSPKMKRPKVLLVTIFYYLDNIFVSQINHFFICNYLDKSCIVMYYLFEPSYELQLPFGTCINVIKGYITMI